LQGGFVSQFELTLAWIIWVWIFVSSFLASYFANRCISIMHNHSDAKYDIPNKNSFKNLFAGSKNLMFFIKYKSKPSDSIEFIQAAKNWKKVQVVYYLQLACLFAVCLNYLPLSN
jgi:hypothetical protein